MNARPSALAALVLLVVFAGPTRAQGEWSEGFGSSVGFGLGVAGDLGDRDALRYGLEISVDWRRDPFVVSARTACVCEFFGDQTYDVGLLVGPSYTRGQWSGSAGVGVGAAWADKFDLFISSSTSGPVLSLPFSGEVAYQVRDGEALHVALRAFGSVNRAENFGGTAAGFRLRF
jgi:hypothetical protein